MTADQRDTIAFLASPEAFGGEGPVCRIDTHFSVVFMAGETVLKLKRAVANELLDYGSPEKRRQACMDELRLNRRTAPSLYRGVRAVVRTTEGHLRLGGSGNPVDWVVVMRRFDEGGLFLDLAGEGRLTGQLIDGATDAVVQLHQAAEATPDRGGLDDMSWIVDGNLEALGALAGKTLPRDEIDRLGELSRAMLERQGNLLERRRASGRTRRCHGDLHLGNICLVDGVPTPFDAVEFNDRIACSDVLYDVAFLVMDLWDRGHAAFASRVLNRYLWRTGDWDALPLLPLFLSCRAAVHAKTSAWAAAVQTERATAQARLTEARAYLGLALAALDRPSPRLLALGGLSGTGKTTLAMALAPGEGPLPGAVVLRSDVLRKQLAGVPFDRPLPRDSYDQASSDEVYRRLGALSGTVLEAGLSVIADAVFLKPGERAAIEAVARGRQLDFRGFWLEAPHAMLCGRVSARTRDASDADARVVRLQASENPGAVAWPRIDAGDDPASTLARARQVL